MMEAAIAVARHVGDPMWRDRTVYMLESLQGSGVTLDSERLLDDVLQAGHRHPKVRVFLDSLPGYPTDAAVALRQLETLVGAARGAHRLASKEQINESFIVPLSSGRQGFSGGPQHLKNFVRYLMSQTVAHPMNERTKLNYVQFSGDEGGLGRVGAEVVQAALDHFQELQAGPEKLANDLIYWAYSVRIGKRAVTNMHVVEEGVPSICANIYDAIATQMGGEALEDAIGRIFERDAAYVPIEEASEGERLLIERELARRAADLMKAPALLHVSHHDQDSMHHTHRITLS